MSYTVTRWTAAENNLFKSNASSPTATNATSVTNGSEGPMGCDVAFPIQIDTDRWLWLFGDSWWPTAAGQQRLGCKFVNNIVMVQDGTDPSSAATTWYCGPRPGSGSITPSNADPYPYFAQKHKEIDSRFVDHGVPHIRRYAMCGVKIDAKRCLVLGMSHHDNPMYAPGVGWQGQGGSAGTSPIGPWATLLCGDLASGSPNEWNQIDLDVDLPFTTGGINQRRGCTFQAGCAVNGDWLEVWIMGPWDQSGHWSVCRYPLDEVLAGHMRAPYHWDGRDGWEPDRANTAARIRVTPDDMTAEQGGAVFRRPDGTYLFLAVKQKFFNPADAAGVKAQGPREVLYQINPEAGADFKDARKLFDVPDVVNSFDFDYSAYLGEGMGWPGSAAIDWVLAVSTHSTDPPTDPNNAFSAPAFTNNKTYQPTTWKVTGTP